MLVVDPDAHFLEPFDWLNYADPELAAQLPPPRPHSEVFYNRITQGLPKPMEDQDPLDLVSVELRQLTEKTEQLQPEHQEGSSDRELTYYDASARLELCDAGGIDVQFLNATMGLTQLGHQIAESGHPELMARSLTVWNRWAAEQVHGHTDRLMPVTQTDPSDIEGTIAEMALMRAAGSRAFRLTRLMSKSYTHTDYEPMWSAAEDLGMAAYVHIPFSTSVNASFANNGRGYETFAHLSSIVESMATRQFLMAMVFDGVFERHPRLRVILAECGHSWFPAFLFDIDAKTSKIGFDGLPQENFYKLPLKPSEYLQRHVRLTVLPGFIDAGLESLSLNEAIEQLPDPGLLVFSSDYPHVEGRSNAVTYFEQLLPPDEKLRESFFGGSIAEFVGL